MRPEDVSKEEYTNWLFEQARMDLGVRPAEIGMTTPRVGKGIKGMPEPQAPMARSTGAPPRIGRGLLVILRQYLRGGFRYGSAGNLLDYITNLDFFKTGLKDEHPFKILILGLIDKQNTREVPISYLELFTALMRFLQPADGTIGRFGEYLLGGFFGDNFQSFTRFFERLQAEFNVNSRANTNLRQALLRLFNPRGTGTIADADTLVTLLRRLGVGDFSNMDQVVQRLTRRINDLPDGVDADQISQGLEGIYENFLRELRQDLMVTIKVRNASGDLVEQTVNLVEYLSLVTQNGDISDIGALMTILRTTIGTKMSEMYDDMLEYLKRTGVEEVDALEALETVIGAGQEMNSRFDAIFETILRRIMEIMASTPGGTDPILRN